MLTELHHLRAVQDPIAFAFNVNRSFIPQASPIRYFATANALRFGCDRIPFKGFCGLLKRHIEVRNGLVSERKLKNVTATVAKNVDNKTVGWKFTILKPFIPSSHLLKPITRAISLHYVANVTSKSNSVADDYLTNASRIDSTRLSSSFSSTVLKSSTPFQPAWGNIFTTFLGLPCTNLL